jgi:FkbM family methyltransferase
MIEQFVSYIKDFSRSLVIFDVGSRDCKQSIEFYEKFPNAKIFAFECNPNTLPICRENIKNYTDRITLIEGAVCDYDGEITFYPIDQEKTVTTWKDGNPGASSLFKSNGTYNVEKYIQNEIKTNCHRLDTVMNKYNIDKVDIMWMDLQGAELLALKSLGDKLKDLQILHTEVSYKPIYDGQVMFNELNNFMLTNNFIIKNNLRMSGWQEDIIYENTLSNKYQYDIVIPVGPNDIEQLNKQIVYTKKNILGYRNIYIISYDPSVTIDGCITIPETIFPFSINTVAKYHGKLSRNGWYLQQLLKLYAGFVIEGIMDKYLVIDSDTYFLKPTTFIQDNMCCYNHGNEYNKPYFIHMKKLHPSLLKYYKFSGICHHMMFEVKYIKQLFNLIENYHKDFFYNIFLKNVTEYSGSGASEYELYFNFMLIYNKDKIKKRDLIWKNVSNLNDTEKYDYVSCHWYNRDNV